MSKNRDYKPEDILFPNQTITTNDLVKEMETSFMEYSMSVIVDRALPDVRDGLKPVHRRILYALYEDNLTSDKPFRKRLCSNAPRLPEGCSGAAGESLRSVLQKWPFSS